MHQGGEVRCITTRGDIAVSSSFDHVVRVWDMASGVCTKVLKGHSDEVTSVALSRNGKVVVSGSHDSTVRIWNMTLMFSQKILQGHNDTVNSVALTNQGDVAVSGSNDGTVRVWDVVSGDCKHILRGHTSIVWCVAVTPDGIFGLSGNKWSAKSDRILVWDARTGECRHAFNATIESIAVTECDKLALCLSIESIRVLDVESGQCIWVLKFQDLKLPKGMREAFWTWLSDEGSLLAWANSSRFLTELAWHREKVPPLKIKDITELGYGKITIEHPNRGLSNLSATFDDHVFRRPFINFEKNRVLVVRNCGVCVLEIVDPPRR